MLHRWLALTVLSLTLLSVILQPSRLLVRSPELFGDGQAYIFSISRLEFGVLRPIGVGDTFVLGGIDHRGYIVQVLGPRVEQYGPYGKSSLWAFYYEREDCTRWRGRVEFRGHFRPFCGTRVGSKFPKVCMWR